MAMPSPSNVGSRPPSSLKRATRKSRLRAGDDDPRLAGDRLIAMAEALKAAPKSVTSMPPMPKSGSSAPSA
jgi:hypothetical protein